MKLHFSPGKIFLLIYTFLVFLSFCAPLPESLKSSTESAGKNKNEIKKLIRHYRSPVDSLKRESAIFLISNMKGSYTLDTNSVSPNNVYFDLMEDLYRTYEGRYGNELLLHAMDSFNNSMGIVPGRPESTYLEDLKTVKADFLIENIDLAMEAWQNSPWGVNVSFKDFCNFILPYKFSKTYWEEARRLFLKKYAWVYDSVNDSPDCFYADKLITEEVNSWFNEDTPIFFFNIPWLKPITFYNLLKGKWGDCEDANSIKATALRALGVPVAFDFLPQWGNHFAPHYFYKVIDPRHDTIKHLISNATDYFRNTTHIISGASQDYYGNLNGLNPELVLWYAKTVPKVFRINFAFQNESLASLKSATDEVPSLFTNDRLSDVSKDYIECSDVEIGLINPGNSKYAYLCVSRFDKWNPVQWAKVENGRAQFTDMGRNIVYLPAYYNGFEMVPAGNPFHLTIKGEVKEIVCSNEKQTLTLHRKFPYYLGLAEKAGIMCGTRFQGANKPDLSDTVTLFSINRIYHTLTETTINDQSKYRYLIYQFAGQDTDIAEMAFFTQRNNNEIKLTGKKIGNKGRYGYLIENAMDEDWLSYFANDTSENSPEFIGLDLGEGNETRVSKIQFCPRNDKNNISPENVYELFYWNGKWISMGIQKGEFLKPLTYHDVPSGALYWLHNHTEGREERIFTYRDGKQYFW